MKIDVAGIAAVLESDDKVFLRRLEEIYRGFRTQRPSEISVEAVLGGAAGRGDPPEAGLFYSGDSVRIASEEFTGYLDFTGCRGRVEINSSWPLEAFGNFLRNIYTLMIIRDGGLILHASAVARGGMAHVFFGPSGSGKSTVARLSAPCAVLSDDMTVIKRVNGTYMAFGTPYWQDMGSSGAINGCFEVKGLFRLVQDKKVYLERLAKPQAAAEVLLAPPASDKFESMKQQLARTCMMLESVPCYNMHFLPEPSFWRSIDEEFSKRF